MFPGHARIQAGHVIIAREVQRWYLAFPNTALRTRSGMSRTDVVAATPYVVARQCLVLTKGMLPGFMGQDMWFYYDFTLGTVRRIR